MTVLTVFNICLEIWGTVLALMCGGFLLARYRKRSDTASLLTVLALVIGELLTNMICNLVDGKTGDLYVLLNHIANIGVYFCNFLLAMYLVIWMDRRLLRQVNSRWSPVCIHTVQAGTAIMLVLLLVTQFNGFFYSFTADNLYVRGPGFLLSQLFPLVCLTGGAIGLLGFRRRLPGTRIIFLVDVGMLILGAAAQAAFYGLATTQLAMVFVVMLHYLYFLREVQKEAVEAEHNLLLKEKQLAQTRTQLTISQIQPHFLYNTLNTIYYLCAKDSELAQKTVRSFSTYLRTNMDAMTQTEPVPFSAELEHVKTYLEIEQLRFDSRLHVELDIRETEFRIPALTVQPLTENAVKYGICSQPEGGTVRISALRAANGYEISVEDNGAGFDTQAPVPDDGRSHTGIQNVRSRLEMMCGGTLTVVSEQGKGTRAVIYLPEEMGLCR